MQIKVFNIKYKDGSTIWIQTFSKKSGACMKKIYYSRNTDSTGTSGFR